MSESKNNVAAKPIRWWPAWLILAATAIAIAVVQGSDTMPFQRRNLISIPTGAGGCFLLLVWWVFFSRAAIKFRLLTTLGVLAIGGAWFGLFRVVGVTGDLVPVFAFRWRSIPPTAKSASGSSGGTDVSSASSAAETSSYPQFLGPNRDGRLAGPVLATNWDAVPPRIIWRRPLGAGWAGFAVAGGSAITLEQAGDNEQVTCLDAGTGEPRWRYSYAAHYNTPIGGEGPRTTPAVVSNRVYTFGATGWLNCLDLATGSNYWKVDAVAAAGASTLEWGMSGSPLVASGLVIVPAGGEHGHSVMAFDAQSGRIAWSAGDSRSSYGSASIVELAGRKQILVLNAHSIASHDPSNGAVLWETKWGIGYPLVAMPVVVSTNRVMFSAGYNVGAELFEITREGESLVPHSVWKSIRLKAKFSNPVLKDGFVYGLDDGMLACLDVRDGSLRWKGDRYGHGQGLLVADRLLLMSEHGDLILSVPTPEGPGKAQTFPVFSGKTWNPIALSGNRVYARTDREAACIELPIAALR